MAARTLDPEPELIDFESLKKYWYERIKKAGFKDIEEAHERPFLKEWHDQYFRLRYTPEEFEEKQEYYQRCDTFYWRFPFKNYLEKQIWRCHADGLGSRLTARRLKAKFKCIRFNIAINKDTVNKILQRLIEEMKSFSFDE